MILSKTSGQYLITCLIFFLFIFKSFASEYYCYANHIPKEQWQIPDDIYVAKQDQFKMIWFGTKSGLFKFDGHNIIQIKSAPIYIRDMTFVDDTNLLIASHFSGSVVFNTETEKAYPLSENVSSTSSVDGNWETGVWAAGDDFVTRFNRNFKPDFTHIDRSAKHISSQNETAYFINNDTEKQRGLYKASSKGVSLIRSTTSEHMFSTNQRKKLWFNNNGLVESFDTELQSWTTHFSDFQLHSMLEHSSSRVWMTNNNSKLLLFDHRSNKVLKEIDLSLLPGMPRIESDSIKLLLRDHEGSIWAYDSKNLIRISCVDYMSIHSTANINKSRINTMLQSSAGHLWIGGTGGLMRLLKNGDILMATEFEKLTTNASDPHSIYSIVEEDSVLWVLSSKGLFKYDFANNKWSLVSANENHLSASGRLGIWNKSLVLFSKKITLFDRNSFDSTDILLKHSGVRQVLGSITSLSTLGNSEFLISTIDGIGVINIADKTFNMKASKKDWADSIPGNNIISSVLQDSNGDLIGSFLNGKVIMLTNEANGHVKIDIINKSDNIPHSRSIAAIIGDDESLWQASRDALYKFNPKSKKFTRYDVNYGIPERFFYSHIATKHNDDIYFGGNSEIMRVNTAGIQQSEHVPVPIISRITVNHKAIVLSDKNNSFGLDGNHFHIYYGSSNFRHAKQTEYQIRLHRQEPWRDYDNRTEAVLTNLDSGEYEFQVRARVGLSNWSSPSKALHLKIETPLWRTTIAYILYVLLFFFLAIVIIRLRERKLEHFAHRLQTEVIERTKEVTSLLERKNDLFAYISHELRTPLTLIKNPIKRLRDNSNANDRALLDTAYLNSERLNKMVNQLLFLAKVNSPEFHKREKICCEKIIQFIATSINSLAERNQIRITWEVKGDLWIEQLTDSLETILLNLCVNALKYSPKGALVKIKASQSGENVVISVSDTGPGIPKEFHLKIFERFTRINQAGDGVGLGLALVKELVAVNLGTIQISSEYKGGTQFDITLPACDPSLIPIEMRKVNREEPEISFVDLKRELERQNNSNVKQRPPQFDNDQLTLLIVEDSTELCDYLKNLFDEEYCCLVAHDGTKGFEIAKEYCPDIIISDVMMPQVDGISMLKNLRDELVTSHIPIVLLTAIGDENTRFEAYKSLADDFVTKPFNDDELSIRLKRLLEIRRLAAISLLSDKQTLSKKTKNSRLNLKSKDQEFLSKITAQVEKHYCESEFGVSELAHKLFVTERTLQRKLKAISGVSPKEFLRIYRIKKAKELIESGHDSIESIALQVGYKNRTYFYRYFKSYIGETPGEYRKKIMPH